jgi:adhesin HecA-like repeat protein
MLRDHSEIDGIELLRHQVRGSADGDALLPFVSVARTALVAASGNLDNDGRLISAQGATLVVGRHR